MQRQDATKKSIGPILFLYHEESPVSSNLNSKLFRFHCIRPNIEVVRLSDEFEKVVQKGPESLSIRILHSKYIADVQKTH